MNIDVMSLKDRIKEEAKKYKNKIAFQKSCQEKIDFILSNEWLLAQEKTYVRITVSTWISNDLIFHISNVPVDDFIENILGPYHLRFDVLWKMTIDGDENEPVFEFTPINETRTSFKVKEGEFKVCKIIKEVERYTDFEAPRPIYRSRMICE